MDPEVVVWRSGSTFVSTNEVNLHRAQLVLGWMIASGFICRCRTFIISVCNQPPRPAQHSMFSGSVNEDQFRLGRRRLVWLIPLVDERGSAGKTVRFLEKACHSWAP